LPARAPYGGEPRKPVAGSKRARTTLDPTARPRNPTTTSPQGRRVRQPRGAGLPNQRRRGTAVPPRTPAQPPPPRGCREQRAGSARAWFGPPGGAPPSGRSKAPRPRLLPPLVHRKASARARRGAAKYIRVFKSPATVPRGTPAQPVYTKVFKPSGGHVGSIKPLERLPAHAGPATSTCPREHAPARPHITPRHDTAPQRHPQHNPRGPRPVRGHSCAHEPSTTTRHAPEPAGGGDPAAHSMTPPAGASTQHTPEDPPGANPGTPRQPQHPHPARTPHQDPPSPQTTNTTHTPNKKTTQTHKPHTTKRDDTGLKTTYPGPSTELAQYTPRHDKTTAVRKTATTPGFLTPVHATTVVTTGPAPPAHPGRAHILGGRKFSGCIYSAGA
jgi:hypothetical protein